MPSKPKVLVVAMGDVFRMSHRQYIAYLTQVANGESPEITHYGEWLGTIKGNFSDIDAEEARYVLDYEASK